MTGTALVTGATGLVGSHVVEKLVAEGWRVRMLVRSPERLSSPVEKGAELVKGDVLNRESLIEAARGTTHIFHTAAAIIPSGGGYEAYRRLNIDGTANALAAARSANARLLHLSSVAVYGPTARYADRVTDEDTPLEPLQEVLYYARTKRESEQLVLGAFAKGDVWTTAVRPCVIYGRRDRQFTPRIARTLRFGVIPIPGGGRNTLSIVHAANVADAAVLAATTEIAGGQAYNVCSDATPITTREFFQLAGKGLGRRVKVVGIPVAVTRGLLGVARIGIGLIKGTGAKALTFGSLGFLTRDNPFSSERARRELGWTPRVDPRDGVVDAFRWYADSRK